MCRPTTCEVCGKTTWKGCGKHIDSVKEKVPADQWCDKDHSDEEYAAAEKKRGFSVASASRRRPSGSVARAATLVCLRPFRGPHSGRVKELFPHATRLIIEP